MGRRSAEPFVCELPTRLLAGTCTVRRSLAPPSFPLPAYPFLHPADRPLHLTGARVDPCGIAFGDEVLWVPRVGSNTEGADGAYQLIAATRDREESPLLSPWQRRFLVLTFIGWTVVVGVVLWWLANHNGPSVWVFQERDAHEPGFNQTVHSLVGFALRLQRIYPWVLFSPYLALVAWFFPLERERLRRNGPLNLAACAAFAWASHEVNFRSPRVMMALGPPPLVSTEPTVPAIIGQPGGSSASGQRIPVEFELPPPRPPSLTAILRSTILDLLAYGAVTGLVHSVYFHRRLRERERRALVLESHLTRARLHTLKAQLQPHFLFNSLNAITALLRRDPRLAETTLVALSELLRLSLRQSDQQEGPLREELEFVRRYLEIQQTRFGDKLRVEQAVEPQTLEALVPTLVLQPLVENAIRHGIEPSDTAGVVRISASRAEGMLVLTVEDDGVGLASTPSASLSPATPGITVSGSPSSVPSSTTPSPSNRTGTGIGLANLRDRLQALYGTQQKLEVSARGTGGVSVRVEIPWQLRKSSQTTDAFET